MISFELRLDDCLRAPILQEKACRIGECSYLQIIENSAVGIGLICSASRWLVVAFERLASQRPPANDLSTGIGPSRVLPDAAYDQAFGEIVGFPNEFFVAECSYGGGAPSVRLLSGSNGTCPIYVSGQGDKLTGSWNIIDLVRSRSSKRFDEQFLIHAAYRAVYSTRTPYQGVALMPPSSAVHWDGGSPSMVVGEADPEESSIFDIDQEEARAELSRLMKRVWEARPVNPTSTAVELSGGYDSSTVALSMSNAVGRGALHLSIIVPNAELSASQLRRISAVVSECGARGRSVSMADHLPSYANLNRFQSLYYQSESYYSAFHALWTEAVKVGTNIILSGHGGDELFPTFLDETVQDDRLRDNNGPDPSFVERRFLKCLTPSARELAEAPLWSSSVVPSSRTTALGAMARHTPLVLQEGLWPVYPLCNTEIVRFCGSLPFALRFEKALLLSDIERSLPDASMFSDYGKENFLDGDIVGLMRDEASIKSLTQQMIAYDLDIVSPERFRTDVEAFYGSGSLELLHHICSILHLEGFLRESANGSLAEPEGR